MGPLSMSAKQHREYLKLQSEEQRKQAKMQQDESRKQQLHEIKLQEAAAKANQGIGHKENLHAAKLNDLGIKAPRMNKQKLGIPSQNPLAGAGVLGRGQKSLYAEGTDTVPAMLTPGEAVIPEPAAQNPANKPIIKALVEEGRAKNQLKDGTDYVQEQVQPLISNDPRLGYTAPMYNGKYVENIPTRSNNPGNLMYAGQPNAIPGTPKKGGGSFALFANPQAGVEALERQVTLNTQERGQSIQQMMAKYAPKSENKTSKYVKDLSKDLGISPTARVPANKVPELARAISKHEGYKGEYYADGTIDVQHYNDGTENVSWFDKALNFIAGQKPEVPPVEVVEAPKMPNPQTNQERKLTVAERHNNPGNLIFVKQAGAEQGEPKQGGGYWAKFPDYNTGRKALESQINLDTQERSMNLSNFMEKYAPRKDKNDTDAYVATIAKDLGIDPKGKVPAELIPKLADTITRVESDGKYAVPTETKQIPGGGFATNAGGAAFGNPNITREAALSVPRQQAIARGEYVPVPGKTQTTSAMKEKYPQGIPVTPAQVAESRTAKEVPQVETQAPSLLETKPQEANKVIAEVSQSNADIIKGFVNDPGFNQIKDPEEKKSWLENAISSVYGPTGVFSNAELARFAVIAAGGLLTGGSVGGSLKYAGLDALKSADARRAQQGARAAEELKNTRELTERLDSDYRTALGENVPATVRERAVLLYQDAKTPEQKRAVIQLLKMNKSTEDTTGASKPGNVSQGFFDGKPMNFRNQAGNVQRVNAKGEWENIPPAELKRFETEEARTKNVKQMIDSNVNRLTPVLKELNKGDKNYRAEDEAKRYAEAFALIKEDLGPNISPTSFAKMSENTINSAFETAKATGGKLTEEGLRKQFFGNAVIETKMVTGNKEMYMAKDSKGKFTLPSAPYQAALGSAMETYKKQNIDLGEASNALEKKFNSLPTETKKKFTQMSAGAPGSTPMLLWLQQTGGTN
jgi:hypothetical protein